MRYLTVVAVAIFATTTVAVAKPRQARDVTLSLECLNFNKVSATGSFPKAESRLSNEDIAKGFKVTGGSCVGTTNNTNRFILSQISDDQTGWICQWGDLPGAREDSTVYATLRACRIVGNR